MSDELGAKPHYDLGPYVHDCEIRAAPYGVALASPSIVRSRTGSALSISRNGSRAMRHSPGVDLEPNTRGAYPDGIGYLRLPERRTDPRRTLRRE